MATVYTFDPEKIRIADARAYRQLNGVTPWASIDSLNKRGMNGMTEDEILGLAFLVRKQNVPDAEAFTLAAMDDWTLGQCLEVVKALAEADRPQKGSPTSF